MQEREIRLLRERGLTMTAAVVANIGTEDWNVQLQLNNSEEPPFLLSAKRGGPRSFKTSDAALNWCHEIGFREVRVMLGQQQPNQSAYHLNNDDKILLVEDNEDDIELTLRAFRANNIENEILVMRDGAEALDYLFGNDQEHKPNPLPALVLLDLKIPKVNGFEVLRRIRSAPATRLLPVVILSSSAQDEDVTKGYDLGTNSYLQKPVDINSFSQIVGHISKYWMAINTAPPH